MKKILLCSTVLCGLLYADNSSITYGYGIKDYSNSASKINGKIHILDISHEISNHKFSIGYQGDNVDRTVHPISKANRDLDVEKYNAKYIYKANDKIKVKASFIKIIDNLAPTDQGKVYGLGGTYTITKGFNAAVDIYKSDYKNFDVNQYDFSISKGFKIDNLKLKATIIAKKIDIDGQKYGSYSFKDKDYFTTGLKLGANYNGYVGGIGAFFGKRVFTVLDGGTKVQHHAMEQNRTYMLKFGKKFKDFDIVAKYSFQNGKELPENRNDVDTKVVSLSLTYKF
ncbi:hypothetical protein [Arcobacter sp. LA11]|uniref:hypothetical protein n=1 Tax=Arcobacter sp. LA11 TaxID=1898176 RepID=UPI0009350771|nr:hypothetical protein [Arcobacter sp. LA11]